MIALLIKEALGFKEDWLVLQKWYTNLGRK